MLGTLLAEGMTISDELYSVPIETYSAHPFTAGATNGPDPTVSVKSTSIHVLTSRTELPSVGADRDSHMPTLRSEGESRGISEPTSRVMPGNPRKRRRHMPQALESDLNNMEGMRGSSIDPTASSTPPITMPEQIFKSGGADETPQT